MSLHLVQAKSRRFLRRSVYKATATAALFLAAPDPKNVVSAFGVVRQQVRMVEGHSVHRVATLHRQRLVGKRFTAWSPNGRFAEGASSIHSKTFSRIEAHGKNLFCFFGEDTKKQKSVAESTSASAANEDDNQEEDDHVVVLHVHFGMSGAWAVYLDDETPPEPRPTNRLRLEHNGIVADLSAMTVQHGGMELYRTKRAKLGEDPLRKDADPDALWARIKKSKKSIGALIMDQSFFAGPGNIYRAEILFKAGVHPNRRGLSLDRNEFDRVWKHTVALLQRGYETGSILTVDPEEAKALGNPRLRRYIYNAAKCPRCRTSIQSWSINNRTCYACPKCQPLTVSTSSSPKADSAASSDLVTQNHAPFNSHCARESVAFRLEETGPSRLTIKEIKQELARLGVTIPADAKRKAQLVDLLVKNLPDPQHPKPAEARSSSSVSAGGPVFVSPEVAALEKAKAGESLAVEHIAELGPDQSRRARSRAGAKPTNLKVKDIKIELARLDVAIPSKARKAELMDLLLDARKKEEDASAGVVSPGNMPTASLTSRPSPAFVTPGDDAPEKARAGESLAVEDVAELGHGKARKARSRVLFPAADPAVAPSSDVARKPLRKRRRNR